MTDDDDDDFDDDDNDIGERDCTWCGGDGLMDNDDPLWYGAAELVNCSACNGTGMRKHQTIF